MRKRYFEIICDFCKNAINHYPERRPSDKELKDDGIIISKGKHFCNKKCEERFEGKLK